MEGEEDEDVLFAGSPLHQSLVLAGISLSDMEIMEKDTQKLENKDPRLSQEEYDKHETFKDLLRKGLIKVQTLFRLLLHMVFPFKNELLEEQNNRMILGDLLRSKVLDDDDKEFLENFLENTPLPAEAEMEQLVPWKSKLFLVLLVPSLTAYGYQRILEQEEYEWNHMINMDVLAVFSLAVSQKSPVSLIEQGHLSGLIPRQCPELRKLLFCTVREAILVCRCRTKSLITNHPVSPELDAAGRYLAFQPLESYGPCLQKSASEEKELYDLTDGYSVAALKGMVHLCHLHQSEFIKRLVLTFNPSHRGQKVSGSLISRLFIEEITSFTSFLQKWSEVLENSFSFHNCYLLNQEPKDKPKVMDQNSPCRDVIVAVHSLDLHLQAALTRVRSLSSWLEKLDEESQSVDSNFLSHDVITQMMQPIKAELDSCKGCWEEGINRMDKLQRQKPNVDQERSSLERPTAEPKSKVNSANFVMVEDPIIVDQVFEAYTDDDHIEEKDYSWEQPLTAEEKGKILVNRTLPEPLITHSRNLLTEVALEKKKREKEEALRIIKELKSVISVRSQEMQKREADALERYRNLTEIATGAKECPSKKTENAIFAMIGDQTCNADRSHSEDCRSSESQNDEFPLDMDRKEINTDPCGSDPSAKNVQKSDFGVCTRMQNPHKTDLSGSFDGVGEVNPDLTVSGRFRNAGDAELTSHDTLQKSLNVLSTQIYKGKERYVTEMTESSETHTDEYSGTAAEHQVGNLPKHVCADTDVKEFDHQQTEELQKLGCENNEGGGDTTGNINDSDDFLDISGSTSQESMNSASSNQKEILKGTDVVDEGHLSDKSSSYINISTTDTESVHSAISYENSRDDIDQMETAAGGSEFKVDEQQPKSLESSPILTTDDANLREDDGIEREGLLTLEERLELIHGANLSFTSNVAALAAAKSRTFGLVNERTFGGETFGDDSDDDILGEGIL